LIQVNIKARTASFLLASALLPACSAQFNSWELAVADSGCKEHQGVSLIQWNPLGKSLAVCMDGAKVFLDTKQQ
jgi:hypothetical protein